MPIKNNSPGNSCCLSCSIDIDFGGVELTNLDIIEPGFALQSSGAGENTDRGLLLETAGAKALHKFKLPKRAEKRWQLGYISNWSAGFSGNDPGYFPETIFFGNDDGTGGYRFNGSFIHHPTEWKESPEGAGYNFQASMKGPDGEVIASIDWWNVGRIYRLIFDYRDGVLASYINYSMTVQGDFHWWVKGALRGAYHLFDVPIENKGQYRWGFTSDNAEMNSFQDTRLHIFETEEELTSSSSVDSCSRFAPAHDCDTTEDHRLTVTVSNAPGAMSHQEDYDDGSWDRWSWSSAAALNGTYVLEPDAALKYRADIPIYLGYWVYTFEEKTWEGSDWVIRKTDTPIHIYLTCGNPPFFVESGEYGRQREVFSAKMLSQYDTVISKLPTFWRIQNEYIPAPSELSNDTLDYWAEFYDVDPNQGNRIVVDPPCAWTRPGYGNPTDDHLQGPRLPFDMMTIAWQFVPAP